MVTYNALLDGSRNHATESSTMLYFTGNPYTYLLPTSERFLRHLQSGIGKYWTPIVNEKE